MADDEGVLDDVSTASPLASGAMPVRLSNSVTSCIQSEGFKCDEGDTANEAGVLYGDVAVHAEGLSALRLYKACSAERRRAGSVL